VVAGVALLWSSNVRALGRTRPRFELDWRAPEGCLDREAARRAVEAALGTQPESSRPTTVVRVKITATASDGFAADIWIYDPTASGERSFEGADCAQVAQAAILVIAFALNADADASAAPPPTEPADERPSTPTKGRTRDGLGFALGVSVTGDLGSLPQPDAGITLSLGARHGALSAELEASAWLPQTIDAGPVLGSGGKFALYTGALRGCMDLLPAKLRAWELGPCAGGEVGATSGTGVGLSTRNTERVFWGAGLFGLSLRYLGASPLALGMLAELGVPVHRAEWQIDNFRTVFEASAVVGRTALGVSWLFP
jgi:hypothetical protein